MKKLAKTLKSLEEKPYKSLKRRKDCKFSESGLHDFLLVKPPYASLSNKYNKLTPNQYYFVRDLEDERQPHYFKSKVRYFECSLCGKKKIDLLKKD